MVLGTVLDLQKQQFLLCQNLFFGFRQFTLSPGPTFTLYYIKQIAMLRCGLLEKWESGARLTRTCEGCQGKRDNSNAAARHTDALSKLLQ